MKIWSHQSYRREYIVWITALTHYYTDGIIAGLVKKKYAVSNASNTGLPYTGGEDYLGTIIALKVEPLISEDEEIVASKIHNDIMSVIDEMKAMCYSVVVSWLADSAWIGSNIVLSPKPTAVSDPSPAPPPTNKNDLN